MVGVFGNIIVDLSARVGSFPFEDDEVEILELSEVPGGTGANTAVALGRLGAKTTFFGTVGPDHYGRFLIEKLNREPIESVIRVSPASRTAVCVATYDLSGERRLMTYLGANLDFEMTDSTRAALKNCDIVHICGGTPRHWILFKEATREGTKISFDPGSMVCRTWPEETLNFSLEADYLFINRNEANLIGKEVFPRAKGYVYLKLASEGGKLFKGGVLLREWKAPKVKQVDSTAAGDVFDAAILSGADTGLSIDESIRLAAHAGAITVTRAGAQTAIPKMSEVEAFIQERRRQDG